jgi:glycosyltransferase involved in cell wall biosynthesis
MAGLLAHEWIEPVGGAEKVLDAFADAFTDAEIFCLWNDAPERYDRTVHESFLARTPLRGRKALAMPLMPQVWRSGLPSADYDWLLVSSHLFAHQAHVSGLDPARKFVYTHTPARYLWEPELDARGNGLLARTAAPGFRALDAHAAQSLQHVAANSAFVRDRIRRTWKVDAEVIHPPVDVQRLQQHDDWTEALDDFELEFMASRPTGYLLGASRFVPYKRLDTVIDAAAASDRPVVIAGGGPDEDRLRAHAESMGADARFVINPSNALLATLMQHASIYLFPAIEDFGIMPVEAMALGTPVLVNAQGGASESVVAGETGIALDDFSSESLRAGVAAAERMRPERCRARAQQFSLERFQREIRDWMSLTPAVA